jgi:hypothetical protein
MMAKKWDQMTKNQKLDLLRAELAKLMRRFADVERSKSKKARPKPKVKKASKKEAPPLPVEPSVRQAAE